MAKLFVTDRSGGEHELEAQTGRKVMEILRDAGLPVEASCGGCCACSTCHVYIDPAWMQQVGPADEDELETLDLAFEVRETSRLSCQIPFSTELDGLRLTLGAE